MTSLLVSWDPKMSSKSYPSGFPAGPRLFSSHFPPSFAGSQKQFSSPSSTNEYSASYPRSLGHLLFNSFSPAQSPFGTSRSKRIGFSPQPSATLPLNPRSQVFGLWSTEPNTIHSFPLLLSPLCFGCFLTTPPSTAIPHCPTQRLSPTLILNYRRKLCALCFGLKHCHYCKLSSAALVSKGSDSWKEEVGGV